MPTRLRNWGLEAFGQRLAMRSLTSRCRGITVALSARRLAQTECLQSSWSTLAAVSPQVTDQVDAPRTVTCRGSSVMACPTHPISSRVMR